MIRRALVVLAIATAGSVSAQVPVEKVRLDTLVIERVIDASQAAKRSLPAEILERIANDSVINLRGPRPDGTYEHAYYDRFEAGRRSESCSVEVHKEGEFTTCEASGSNIYRVIVEVPSRRLLVARNRKLWVERVDFEYIPMGSSQKAQASVDVKAWLEPSSTRGFDLPAIARQVTARVVTRADAESGYGNLLVTVLEARVIDDARSPYANAVARAKTLVRTIERGDAEQIRSGSAAVREALPAAARAAEAPADNIYMELQDIEDLLMGTEEEKRDGMERLRQLRRRLRTR